MAGTLSLAGSWGLTFAEGDHLVPPRHYMQERLEGRRLLEAEVPEPVQSTLMRAGLLGDINTGLHSLYGRWAEEMFWIYRRTFDAPEEALRARSRLVFDRLDLEATVLLNGTELGTHRNAHRPAVFDTTGALRPGANLLVVLVSAGMHSLADKPAADYRAGTIGLLTKRSWLRRPAYSDGWDWQARCISVGILGDVRLAWCDGARLGQVSVHAEAAADLARATVRVRAVVEPGPAEATLRARLPATGAAAEAAVPPADATEGGGGERLVELELSLERPALWWPRGHGEQALHTVEVELVAGEERQGVTRRVGVRRVEIDQSPHPEGGNYCILTINGRPVFAKGGNWVPPDMLYSTVSRDRIRELIDLAVGAEFNLLRIWGGGCYASADLLEACDEAGLLVWHDFAFACAKYPAQEPDFLDEIRAEIRWVTRQTAHHPSLVVWCGNNEVEWADWGWGYDRTEPTSPHAGLFHREIPRIARRENPATPYWIGSPWSPDYHTPNDPLRGDQHPWSVSLNDPEGADWWQYRRFVDRFPNEGGVMGASSPATLRQFLPEGEREVFSPSWDHHDNPFACLPHAGDGSLGRIYRALGLWTGLDPRALELERYALASGLLQAEGLSEYIANYRRRMFSSACAVFWMFNDSWPVTHGWTIVDYYRRKKLAYHPVRRAFRPVTVVVAEEGEEVVVFGVNETPEPREGTVRGGFFLLAGGRPVEEERAVELPPNASTPLLRFPRRQWDELGTTRSGAFAVLFEEGVPVAQHRLFVERFRDLAFAEAAVRTRVEEGALWLEADVFAWGVCLDTEGEAEVADNCFDLLPGIAYRVAWPAGAPAPEPAAIGSRDVLAPRG